MNPREVITRRNVEVELIRLVIGTREAITSNHPQLAADQAPDLDGPGYGDQDVLAAITFRVTNNTNREINFLPNESSLVISGRQVPLDDYLFSGQTFHDPYIQQIQPGVTTVTGVWVGMTNVELEEADTVTYFHGQAWIPTIGNQIQQWAGGFTFQVDVSERSFEPPPSDLEF